MVKLMLNWHLLCFCPCLWSRETCWCALYLNERIWHCFYASLPQPLVGLQWNWWLIISIKPVSAYGQKSDIGSVKLDLLPWLCQKNWGETSFVRFILRSRCCIQRREVCTTTILTTQASAAPTATRLWMMKKRQRKRYVHSCDTCRRS